MAIDIGTVLLPYHAVFDILSRTPVKTICRFRCVSKGWRDLICSPIFAAAHRSRHGPLLVDAGSFEEEEPDEGRDMRLMDMDGNVVRVIKGVGGYGMMCNTSHDDLICVHGASCGGVNVVDPATGKVLVSCPHMEVRELDIFPYAATRYYITFGFGRAIPSGEYKLVRLVADQTWEIFTLGDGKGWRQMQPSQENICYKRGSPIVINGVMHVFQNKGLLNNDTLLCFDLESELWKGDVIGGLMRVVDKEMWRGTKGIRQTELNGALCIVHSVFSETHYQVDQPDPFTNIWILDNSDKNTWINAYRIILQWHHLHVVTCHSGRWVMVGSCSCNALLTKESRWYFKSTIVAPTHVGTLWGHQRTSPVELVYAAFAWTISVLQEFASTFSKPSIVIYSITSSIEKP